MKRVDVFGFDDLDPVDSHAYWRTYYSVKEKNRIVEIIRNEKKQLLAKANQEQDANEYILHIDELEKVFDDLIKKIGHNESDAVK